MTRGAALAVFALAVAGVAVVVHRRVLGIVQRPSWPPGADAVTADGAESATEAFRARREARPRDVALEFAWSTAATLDPWVDGSSFFPRIFADVEAARSSVHVLMFGWREGETALVRERLLEPDIARSARGAPPSGRRDRLESRLWDKLTYYI